MFELQTLYIKGTKTIQTCIEKEFFSYIHNDRDPAKEEEPNGPVGMLWIVWDTRGFKANNSQRVLCF